MTSREMGSEGSGSDGASPSSSTTTPVDGFLSLLCHPSELLFWSQVNYWFQKNNISVEFQGPVGKMSILVWTSGLGNLNGRCRFYSLFRKSKEPSSRCRERLHGFITNTLEGRLVKSHEGKWMCRGTKWRFSWTSKTLAKRLDRIMGVPQNWVSPKP